MSAPSPKPPTKAQLNAQRWAQRAGRPHNDDDWAPFPPQERFLALGCFEALYGGAAGGGKTDALLVWLSAPVGRGAGRGYLALGLRRTSPELQKTLIFRSFALYPRLGGVPRDGGSKWVFPGGETILLEHCELEKDVTRYQGAQFARVAFDELTTFTEYQYLYLFSRIRSAAGLQCGIRAASNPGGPGHEWVRARFFDWVSWKSKEGAAPGDVRYFVRRDDVDVQVPKGTPDALGRTFIPARLEDNPALEESDPEYRARLRALPELERKRLEDGNWDAEPAKRDYWDRTRIGAVFGALVPKDEVLVRARAWDFGATASPTADASTGVRLAKLKNGRIVIEHCAHFRGASHTVDAQLVHWAEVDRELDATIIQVIPQDPGAAGKKVIAHYQSLLGASPLEVERPTGDKATRFKPLSSRQLAGFVDVVDDGSWDVAGLHSEAESFPLGRYDDRVDALSDAYNTIAPYIEVPLPEAPPEVHIPRNFEEAGRGF